MSVSIMQYPSDGKLSLQKGGDGKPVSVQKEGKVLALKFITPVDPSDRHVQKLGNWAVDEHNCKTGSDLEFEQVTRGFITVCGGITFYDLYIDANDEDEFKTYEAVIEEIMEPMPTTALHLFKEKKC